MFEISMLYQLVSCNKKKKKTIFYWLILFLSIAISKTDLKQWCTEHEYELLQLEKSTTSETDDDEEVEDEENTHRK